MQNIQRSTDEISSMFRLANSIARRYGKIGVHDPEDIAQMAMLKLLNRHDERPATNGWMFTVVRSAAYDVGRAHARELRYCASSDFFENAHAVCEKADESRYVHTRGTYIPSRDERDPDLIKRLIEMLQQLTKPLRDVLVLYAQGYSYEEIAELTQSKIGTVRSRLHYARKRAQTLLGDLT
jgi:RNA polymerase sigma factor (sigma-70 family)